MVAITLGLWERMIDDKKVRRWDQSRGYGQRKTRSERATIGVGPGKLKMRIIRYS